MAADPADTPTSPEAPRFAGCRVCVCVRVCPIVLLWHYSHEEEKEEDEWVPGGLLKVNLPPQWMSQIEILTFYLGKVKRNK